MRNDPMGVSKALRFPRFEWAELQTAASLMNGWVVWLEPWGPNPLQVQYGPDSDEWATRSSSKT